jgi:hypothetical protein
MTGDFPEFGDLSLIGQNSQLQIISSALAGGDLDELFLLLGRNLPYRRIRSGLESADIIAKAPVLPVAQAGQLFLLVLHKQSHFEPAIVNPDRANAAAVRLDIYESTGLATSVNIERLLAFSIIVFAVENLIILVHSSGFAFALPDNVGAFINQGPAEIAVIQYHVRDGHRGEICDNIMNSNGRLSNS